MQQLWERLSSREKGIIASALGVAVVLGLHQVWQPIRDAFAAQTALIEVADRDLASLSSSVRDYQRLKARRDELEGEFSQVESREGSVSYLESLFRTTLQAKPGEYTIDPDEGGGSEGADSTYRLSFRTANLSNLVTFMKDLTYGSQRFLMPKLTIDRSFAGDRLEVKATLKTVGKSSGGSPSESPRATRTSRPSAP
jgi:hypothetical protein